MQARSVLLLGILAPGASAFVAVRQGSCWTRILRSLPDYGTSDENPAASIFPSADEGGSDFSMAFPDGSENQDFSADLADLTSDEEPYDGSLGDDFDMEVRECC